jgi:cell division inhibitor SepF
VSKFIDKMMDIMKLNEYEDEDTYDEMDEYDEYNQYEESRSLAPESRFKSYSGGKNNYTNNNTSKIVNLQASVQMEVVVIHPESYDEAQNICDHIKSQKPVIINLEKIEHNIAQRIMDFISGSCYTLNGNLQRVTNNIFIIAPENVDIAGDFKEELKSNGIIFPWKNDLN